MGEPTIIVMSQPCIDRGTLSKLQRPTYITLQSAGNILWNACRRLHVSVPVYTTAMLHLQRFVVLNPGVCEEIEKSSQALHTACCASVAVALLNEECMKKITEIIDAVHFDRGSTDTLPSTNVVTSVQRDILETICFNFKVTPAPIMLIKLAKSLGLDIDKEVLWTAWNLAIDAYQTTAVLQFPANNVAAACLEIALRSSGDHTHIWDRERHRNYIQWVALRTSTRLLLEFLEYSDKANTETHSKIKINRDLLGWLRSLQKSQPDLHHSGAVNIVRDPEVPVKGTARYRVQ